VEKISAPPPKFQIWSPHPALSHTKTHPPLSNPPSDLIPPSLIPTSPSTSLTSVPSPLLTLPSNSKPRAHRLWPQGGDLALVLAHLAASTSLTSASRWWPQPPWPRLWPRPQPRWPHNHNLATLTSPTSVSRRWPWPHWPWPQGDDLDLDGLDLANLVASTSTLAT
jgi:hypothetical protein